MTDQTEHLKHFKTEVSAIFYFKTTTKPMIKEDDPLFKQYAKKRTEKESYDIDMISDAFEQLSNNVTNVRILTYFFIQSLELVVIEIRSKFVFKSSSSDAHFMMSSQFYQVPDCDEFDRRKFVDYKLFEWTKTLMKEFEIRSIYMTFYARTLTIFRHSIKHITEKYFNRRTRRYHREF